MKKEIVSYILLPIGIIAATCIVIFGIFLGLNKTPEADLSKPIIFLVKDVNQNELKPRDVVFFQRHDDIEDYLSLSYEEIGLLPVSQHPPGEVIYLLCQRVKILENYISADSLGHWIPTDMHQRFKEFRSKYGNIHNTPWENFTLEEKVFISMFGGSGSKLGKEELEEFRKKYTNVKYICK